MPHLKESTRLERRRRIAAAALQGFATNGIGGTSMADIIRLSGLSSGAIYSHFDSKADLLRYVMSTMLEERFTALGKGPDSTTVITPEQLLERLLEGASADRAQTGVLVQVWGEMSGDAALAAVADENLAHLRALLVDSLGPWAERAAGGAERAAGGAERAAGGAQAAAARTADWLLAASFGYATLLALRPTVDPASMRASLLGVARELGGPPVDNGPTG